MANELQLIMNKLNDLDTKISRVDVSITGDPSRGLIGMKQHVETLQKELHDHTQNDAVEFTKIKNLKSWFAGAMFVASAVISSVVYFVNLLIK